MSKLLEKAVAAVRTLPPAEQDRIARAILARAADNDEPEAVDAAHLLAVMGGLAQAKRGERATAPQGEAALRRFDG